MPDTWTWRLLHLNAEIVELDADLAAALRAFFASTDAGKGTTETKDKITADVARLTLLRRLRDHHLENVRDPDDPASSSAAG